MQYVGKLDVSDITAKLKQIQQNVKDNGIDVLSLDKSMDSLEQLEREIQKSLSKGFKTPADVKNLDKTFQTYLKNADKINEAFQKASSDKIAQDIEEANDKLKEVQKSYSDISKKAREAFSAQATGLKDGKKYASWLLQSAQNGEKLEEVQKRISKELEDQVKARRQQVTLAKQEVDAAQDKLSKLEDQQSAMVKGTLSKQSNYTGSDGKQISDTQFGTVRSVLNNAVKKGVSKGSSNEQIYNSFLSGIQKEGINFNGADSWGTKFIDRQVQQFKELQNQIAAARERLNSYKSDLKKSQKDESTAEQTQSDIAGYVIDEKGNKTKTGTGLINDENVVKLYQQLVQLTSKLTVATESLAKAKQEENQNTPDYEDVAREMSKASLEGEKFKNTNEEIGNKNQELSNSFDNITNALKTYISLGAGLRKIQQVFKDTYNDVTALDKAFSEIAMVTDYSVNDMWKSYSQYASIANSLGQQTESVVKASGLFYQQGLETNEALKLTTDTMKLATLSGLDYEEATSYMTAALRGFHMEMDQGSHITDVYSELAAKAAADVEGIANAMNKTASIGA